MSDGKGCVCYAMSESDCACDADWTPQELIDARQSIALLEEQVAEKEEEILDYIKLLDYLRALIPEKDLRITLLEKDLGYIIKAAEGVLKVTSYTRRNSNPVLELRLAIEAGKARELRYLKEQGE